MTEQVTTSAGKTPGIVIFVAILNFLGAGAFFLLGLLSSVVLLFGNVMGLYEFVTKQMTQYYAQGSLSIGLNVLFGLFMAVGFFFFVFYLLIGVGLLKGRKLAWYFQVVMSVLGLLGFPFGTVLNIVILVFFFQRRTREYFNV